jgi:uncharacterized cofD-like protein
VEGQVQVSSTAGRISRVSLVPPDASPPPEALAAIASADQVVIGPGSLYSSVLAVVAVPAIREALAATSATKIYVCNLRPEAFETTGLDAAAHVGALRAHGVDVDVVLHDPATLPAGALADAAGAATVVESDLGRPDRSGHDPARLAAALAARLA